MQQEYRTQVYFAWYSFLLSFFLFWILMGLVILIDLPFDSKLLAIIGFGAAIGALIGFISKIKSMFTKEVLIRFGPDGMSITVFKKRNVGKETTFTFRWEQLRSYRIYFTQSKLTYLDLYLRDGKSREFGFKENKSEDETIADPGPNLFKILRHYVREYNSAKQPVSKILLRPGFLTTKTGTLVLWLTGLLMLIAVALLALRNFRFLAFLLIGAAAYLPLLAKRKSDKAFYNRVSEMD